MDDRRTFLALAAALLPMGLAAQGATPAPGAPRELARHPLSGALDGLDAILLELKPGAGPTREHRHTGPVLGYVLEGQVRFGVDHGPEQIIPTGGTFFEPTGALHSTWGSATSAPARVLVFMVVPKGSSGTTVA